MKALTICQPYAHLIAVRAKRVENRNWYTSYRGLLAIHAGKSRAWLDSGEDPGQYVFGAVIAIADLVDCIELERLKRLSARPQFQWVRRHPHTNGPWCWILEDVRRIDPVFVRGRQGLWDWSPPRYPENPTHADQPWPGCRWGDYL